MQLGAWALELLLNLRVPFGFEISVVAQVPCARSLTLSPGGTAFVGSWQGGRTRIEGMTSTDTAVYALTGLDTDDTVRARAVTTPMDWIRDARLCTQTGSPDGAASSEFPKQATQQVRAGPIDLAGGKATRFGEGAWSNIVAA